MKNIFRNPIPFQDFIKLSEKEKDEEIRRVKLGTKVFMILSSLFFLLVVIFGTIYLFEH